MYVINEWIRLFIDNLNEKKTFIHNPDIQIFHKK